MENTKFSIVIPTYNIENYIENCIDSILKQEYSNFEIIVVNDGSTDKSEEVVRKINSDKIKLVNKKNGGLSSARNEGIKHVTGDYIWFVDGDDYIEKNALNILNTYIEKQSYDVISFRYYKEDKENKILQVDKIDNNSKMQYPLVNTSACTKIFKKDFFINNNFSFTDGKIYEDLSLIPYIMCVAKSVKFIDEPLYSYIYRDNSIMNMCKKFNPNRDDKFFAMDTLYKLFKNKNIDKKYKEELEYLTIKHLLIVYSTEIFPFSAKIYRKRCLDVLKYLKNINLKWYKNKYLNKSAFATKIYVLLFRYRMFWLCKLLLNLKK